MKPYQIFLFVLSVIIVLGIIMLVFPKDGIKINDNFTIYFPTFEEMFLPDTVEYANIDSIVEKQNGADSLIALMNNDSTNIDSVVIDEETLKSLIHNIEFPDNDSSILYSFFNKASIARQQGQYIRILHYGDSQIEGDRITCFLRSKLQAQFGGMGIGLVPGKQPYDFDFSIVQKNSDNWKRYTIYGKVDTNVHHNKYGALAAFARFSPLNSENNDSVIYKGWIEFSKSNISYGNTKAFSRCKVYYGNNKKPVKIVLSSDGIALDSSDLPTGNLVGVYSYNFANITDNVKLSFRGYDSPDIYGITLDGGSGVAVDNIGLRGSAGTIFTAMNKEHLAKMYDLLNVQLIILQFGGNVMPYIKSDKEAENYGNWFYSQIMRIKSARPGVPVIVIGPSDMSTKIKDKYVTFPYLEKVRDELKKASFKAKAGFWDMYEAMGGKNSMPAWVNADPPLAGDDYTHLTPRGAQIIANMFYNSFIYEYNQYLKTQKK